MRRLSHLALAATIGAAVAVTGTDSSNPNSAPTTASINTQDPYDVAVDAPTALPQRPAFDTPVQRLIDVNAASVGQGRPAALYDVQVDVPTALLQHPAFDTPIQRLIDANAASVSQSRPAALSDVQVDVPSGLPQRPAFDTPIQRLIDANQATTMHLGPTDRDGFSRWFAGS